MTIETKSLREMDGYIRVSRRMGREGPGYISPKIQREAIQRWADYRGVKIVRWHEDEDESGGSQQRPGIREAMRRVEEGETQGIACWRLNRFARNVSEALDDVKKVQSHGGALAFVEEDIDPTGPFGEFILVVLLAVASLELNNIKASWRAAKERAMERGAAIGPTPYGYKRDPDGVIEADPVDGPIVTEAFRRAARDGFEAAVDYLVKHGDGRYWSTYTVRRFLSKTSYLGTHRYGELTTPVPQLVTRAIWEAAQPQPAKTRRPKGDFPLTGFATCACGQHLVGARGGNNNQRMYRCAGSLARAKVRCASPATVTAELLEEHARSWLLSALDDHPGLQGGEDLQGKLTKAEIELEAAEEELDSITGDLSLRRSLGAKRFQEFVDLSIAAHDEAKEKFRLVAVEVEGQQMTVPLRDVLTEADLAELGRLLRGALESIVVVKGRTPLPSRVTIVPKGAPAEARVLVS